MKAGSLVFLLLCLGTVWSKIENCKTYDPNSFETKCTACVEGFILDSSQSYCSKCTAGCMNCDSVTNKCSKCYEDLYMTPAGECQRCAANCKMCDGPVCKECKKSYFLKDAACKECLLGCEVCPNETECTTCIPLFVKREKDGKQTCELNLDLNGVATAATWLVVMMVCFFLLVIVICIAICCCCGLCAKKAGESLASNSNGPQYNNSNQYQPMNQGYPQAGYNQSFNVGYGPYAN